MEVVAAVDSDERGLALINFVNVLRKVLTFAYTIVGKVRNSDAQLCQSSLSNLGDMPTVSEEQIFEKVQDICREFELDDITLEGIAESLNESINQGLSATGNKTAKVKCFPTYVRDLPNGKEEGRFLALDLGGTNFRVLLITLGKNAKFHMDSKIYAVPQDIMHGSGEGLFDHIASCLAAFVNERKLHAELLPLGFTFSFPCAQEGLTKARLTQWTKGFKCSGVEGNDVVQLLEDAIERRGDVKIKICAILNDTTGTLMSCAWKNRNCRIGLIVGTGLNACYTEKLENVELWDGDLDEPNQDYDDNTVIINTEWGAFGDDGCLSKVRTQYDINIDNESINPGRQLYEKMISGMYLGEIVRQVLVRLVNDGLLFGGVMTDILNTKGNFYSKYISEIEAEKTNSFTNCRNVLEDLDYPDASDMDCANILYVCKCVSRRAAYLAATGVSVLLNRIKEEKVTVAVDGSVYRFHPYFHDLMEEKIATMITPGLKFDLMLSEDGSGRGAALVAAVASRKAQGR